MLLIRAIRKGDEFALMHLHKQIERSIRVLVIDDSIFMRNMISKMLKKSPDIDVVGTAMNGLDAISQTQRT